MGYVPFFVVISGVVFLVIGLNYHTFKNYRNQILSLVARIQEAKKQVREDVDELEILSVPELETFCENMCGYLSGKVDNLDLQQRLDLVNRAFDGVYTGGLESKHIQEEILKSINRNVKLISALNQELKETQYAYEKLLNEKPYSTLGKLMHFKPVSLPWESASLSKASGSAA